MSNASSNAPQTPPPRNRRVPFEALLSVEDPHLLEGLDVWLKLGLISDQQVKRWARQHLRSLLSEAPVTNPIANPIDNPVANPAAQSINRGVFISETGTPIQPATATAATPRVSQWQMETPPDTAKTPRDRSLVSRVLSSFMAEISVVWLLFLGVFLVVVSSAVLAATQWQNFNAIVQYGILLAYTIGFGVVALWTGKQENLRLTSRMLMATTLLIIPVNFWMMDGFGLFRSGIGWLIGIVAAIALFGMQWLLLREEQVSGAGLGNLVGLSALQVGWLIPGMPLVATYAGTIGTAAIQVRSQATGDRGMAGDRGMVGDRGMAGDRGATGEPDERGSSLRLVQTVTAFGTLLLIARSTLVAGVPLSMLGMAIGICGALLCWENRAQERSQDRSDALPQSGVWLPIGILLLVFGWFVAIVDGNLWQALGVSVLALALMWERLHRLWERSAVVGFIAIGLQTYSLLRVLVPPTWRSIVMDWITQVANLSLGAWELTGLGFFLSLIGIAGFAEYLRRQNKPELAQVAQTVGLWVGFALIVPGIFNPAVRSIYFLGVFLLLWAARLVKSPQSELSLPEAYLIHGVGILALLSGLEWQIGTGFTILQWSIVFGVLALLEWILSISSASRAVKHSAWTIGLGFAGLMYGGLTYHTLIATPFTTGFFLERWRFQEPPSGLYIGLVLPAALTIGAYLRGRMMNHFPVTPKVISTWSVVGLGIQMLLALQGMHSLILSGAIATALMILNAKVIRTQWATAIVVAIGLLFTNALTRKLTQLGFVDQPWWGLIVIGLWILHALCCIRGQSGTQSSRTEPRLSQLYANALDGWAIAIVTCGLALSIVAECLIWSDGMGWSLLMRQAERTLEVTLFMVGIVFRTRDRWYSNWGLLGLTIGIESLVSHFVQVLPGFSAIPNTAFTIANVILMFGTQIAGDLWLRRFDQPAMIQARIDRPSIGNLVMLHAAPLCFGSMAFLMSHRMFVQWGGAYTILVALVAIIIARRDVMLKLLTYVGVIGVTVGLYELVSFKLIQNSASSMVGDSFVILTLVGAVLAWGYRLLHRPIRKVLKLEDTQVMAIGHAHFAGATGLGLLALFPLVVPGGMTQTSANLLAGIYGLLGCYALSLGRVQSGWLTIGILQLWTGIAILLLDWLPQEIVWAWGAAIAALIAYITAAIPWGKLGYTNVQPIRNCAIILPGTVLAITVFSANIPSLLLAGGFYAWLATVSDRFRLSYVSVALGIWAAWRLCHQWGLTDPLWYVSIVCDVKSHLK